MVKIISVEKISPADRAGILAGDVLVSINGNAISDVLDYRFYLVDRSLSLVLDRDGESLTVTIKKSEYDDIGLEFETPLMDKKHSCANKCIFCFIDQLPKGMRESLYFKDDDSRLSFLHGNYITLTNMKDADIDRIIKMHISPLRVSVHTTNPELRVMMMKNKRAGEVLKYLRRVADAGIAIDAQVVLCRGINDGEELIRTMNDLLSYYPALSSVSIVPAGLTGHRDGLYPLSPYTPEEASVIIDAVDEMGKKCIEQHGSRIFFAADELYIRASRPIPPPEYYEDFAQIEDGVGLIASLCEDFGFALEDIDTSAIDINAIKHRFCSLVTGEAAYECISSLAEKVCRVFPGLKVAVYAVKNNFFGGHVTVAGLLTGKDISEQLSGADLGDELIVPEVAVRRGDDIFLDDMTLTELSEKLCVKVSTVANDGYALLSAILGLRN